MVKSKAILSVIGLIFVVGIAGVVYVYSKSAENPLLPSSSPQASGTQIKITERVVDAFKTDEVDSQKWIVGEVGGATVKQTATNNLRMDLPSGNSSPSGTLVFKQVFKNKGDFRVTAAIYKPQVVGNGTGASGIRFTSTGSENDETAVVQWRISNGTSKVTFIVRGSDGKVLESEAMDLAGDVALLRLDRINKEYTAYFKPGRDYSSDSNWKTLGTKRGPSLGKDGRVALFTNSNGPKGVDPKVVGRFDQVNIAWEGEPVDVKRASFQDSFSNDVLAKQWKVRATAGAKAEERPSDNLVMAIPAGAVNGKPGSVNIRRNSPTVKKDKDFVVQTLVLKPVVTGPGLGVAGVSFVSTNKEDDEAARVAWRVGENISQVVFSVRNPDGTLAENAVVDVDQKEKSLTLRLVRKANTYSAFFRTGDLDTEFVKVGADKTAEFGADGTMSLYTSNTGSKAMFPRVVARFDQAYGSAVK